MDFAEFERGLIRARTGEGRKRATANGIHMGTGDVLGGIRIFWIIPVEFLEQLAAGDDRHPPRHAGQIGDRRHDEVRHKSHRIAMLT